MGNTDLVGPSVLVNLIGENAYQGPVKYRGIEEVLALPKTYIHVYGKKETKPGRKMGHITIMGADKGDLVRKATHVKEVLKVVS
jgi:5-(carboxyamino)imidazole ribonucleotide synthase